jgi:hypothetical protein
LLNSLFFGFVAGGFEGFGHQMVVNDDVRSYVAPMCMVIDFYTQSSTLERTQQSAAQRPIFRRFAAPNRRVSRALARIGDIANEYGTG